eukprot:g5392.t1
MRSRNEMVHMSDLPAARAHENSLNEAIHMLDLDNRKLGGLGRQVGGSKPVDLARYLHTESVDFLERDTIEHNLIHAARLKAGYFRYRHLYTYSCAVAIGMNVSIAISLALVIINEILQVRVNLTNHVLQNVEERDVSSTINALAVNTITGMVLAGIAMLSVMWQPAAAASGIPGLISYLNGSIPNGGTNSCGRMSYFDSVQVCIAKYVGMLFSIGSGLPIGPEGPIIHVSAIIGKITCAILDAIERKRSKWFNLKTTGFTFEKSEIRDFIAMGAAAGITTAFHAPLAGVLFVVEEAASFFTVRSMEHTFCACLTAYWMTYILNGFPVNFVKFLTPSGETCTTFGGIDIPVFFLMAIVGGFLGAFFNHIVESLNEFRHHYIHKKFKRRVVEVLTLAFISSFLAIKLPVLWNCRASVRDILLQDSSGCMAPYYENQISASNIQVDYVWRIIEGDKITKNLKSGTYDKDAIKHVKCMHPNAKTGVGRYAALIDGFINNNTTSEIAKEISRKQKKHTVLDNYYLFGYDIRRGALPQTQECHDILSENHSHDEEHGHDDEELGHDDDDYYRRNLGATKEPELNGNLSFQDRLSIFAGLQFAYIKGCVDSEFRGNEKVSDAFVNAKHHGARKRSLGGGGGGQHDHNGDVGKFSFCEEGKESKQQVILPKLWDLEDNINGDFFHLHYTHSFNCPSDTNADKIQLYNEMASLWLNGGLKAVKFLLMRGVPHLISPSTLTCFGIVYFLIAAITAGVSVPAGLVVPMLLIGGSFGRLVGVLMIPLHNSLCKDAPAVYPEDGSAIDSFLWSSILRYHFEECRQADPAMFAVIGCAAFMGGSGRITLFLATVLLELTNDIQLVAPMGLVTLISMQVANFYNHGLYHGLISGMDIPFLNSVPDPITSLMPIRWVMATPVVTARSKMNRHQLFQILKGNRHSSFPICHEKGGKFAGAEVAGLIRRKNIFKAIQASEDSGSEKPISLIPYMDMSPLTVTGHTKIFRVHTLFVGLGLRSLCVVDSRHRLIGIVTRKDLMQHRILEATSIHKNEVFQSSKKRSVSELTEKFNKYDSSGVLKATAGTVIDPLDELDFKTSKMSNDVDDKVDTERIPLDSTHPLSGGVKHSKLLDISSERFRRTSVASTSEIFKETAGITVAESEVVGDANGSDIVLNPICPENPNGFSNTSIAEEV